ncbi:MAG: NGG1p interacting factor NIF3 [Candidatus Nealsonbacteria bacterium]
MRIKEIYNLAINKGIESDLRGKERVEKFLSKKKEKFEKLSESAKEEFDKEALINPYLDSRILNISEDKEIKKILVGVDIEPAELLLSKELEDIDLTIAHHPLGIGLAYLSDVMDLQCDVLNLYGVPINIAEGLMKERISEVARGISGVNHQRTVDAAKLLGVNLINLHTPCDNLAANFLKEIIEKNNPETIEDLLKIIKTIPEYREAIKIGAGPTIFSGHEDNRCGKISVSEITGGTNPSPKIYEKMAQVGIGTVVGMHMKEDSKKEADNANLNIVIAGHMSSDSLGLNLFLDELEKQGIEIVPCSGFIRISRN